MSLIEQKFYIIQFDGLMGAGKSTTAKLFFTELYKKGFPVKLLLELDEDESERERLLVPSIEQMYADPKKYAYDFQKEMIKRRNEQLDRAKNGSNKNTFLVLDRAPISCNAFSYLQMKAGNITAEQYEEVRQLALDETKKRGAYPQMLFYFSASKSLLLERIRERGRAGEEFITRDYLKQLDFAFGDLYRGLRAAQEIRMVEIQVTQMTTPRDIVAKLLEFINMHLLNIINTRKRVQDAATGLLMLAQAPALKVTRLVPEAELPKRATPQSAGLDLTAITKVTIPARDRVLVPTGLKMSMPKGCYGRIAARSGLANAFGITVLAGVIDADYRGEVMVLLENVGYAGFVVKPGDRIAQLIIEKIEMPVVREIGKDEHEETARGAGGFGSSG